MVQTNTKCPNCEEHLDLLNGLTLNCPSCDFNRDVNDDEFVIYVTYGGWAVNSAIHAFLGGDEDSLKLCDNKSTRFGGNLPWAGNMDSIRCKRCKSKLKTLQKEGTKIIEAIW